MVANRFLLSHRDRILDLASKRGIRNVRVFGSAARDELGPQSDIDFLVDLEPHATLIDLGAFLMDVEELLGRRVDVVTREAIHNHIREDVLREATPL